MQSIRVDVKQNPYNIYVGIDSLTELNQIINSINHISRIVIITNEVVAKLYLNQLRNTLPDTYLTESYIIPDGEVYKSIKQAEEIYSWLIANKFDRDTLIIAFGGGVIGDLAGFIAATFLRGIRFIQVPTTLLAQVDSSIGGKVGINHNLGKNLIGAFYQPQCVLSDIKFLSTLARDEYICGMGEIIKYALIGDETLFDFIENNISDLNAENSEINEKLVLACARQKAKIVSEDEKEQGIRAILNFGHTFGHALEKFYDYEQLKHGQAVLLGMKCAIFVSEKLGYLEMESSKRAMKLIEHFNIQLPDTLNSTDINAIINFMQYDKKVKRKKINYILINQIGKVFKTEIEDMPLIQEAFERLN